MYFDNSKYWIVSNKKHWEKGDSNGYMHTKEKNLKSPDKSNSIKVYDGSKWVIQPTVKIVLTEEFSNYIKIGDKNECSSYNSVHDLNT